MGNGRLSILDIIDCDGCGGMYDPCKDHLARVHELGISQWKATGDVAIQDIPRNSSKYVLTEHTQHRMGSRRLNKKIAHHVIENGELERAQGEDTFKFIGKTRELDDQSGNCIVVVSVTKEKLSKNGLNPILTVYMEDEAH